MKKIITVIPLSLILLFSVHGQNPGKSAMGIRGGFQIGMHEVQNDYKTWFKYGFSPSLEEESMPNFNLVVYGIYGFTNHIGIQTELNFMFGQGIKGRGSTTSWVDIKYSSLDIPILLKVNFLQSTTRFGILGGPYYTIPLGKLKTKYEEIRNAVDEKNDIDASGLGFIVGFYYANPTNFGNFVADLRFNGDFGKSSEKLGANNKIDFIKRRGITISMGVEFF